VTLVAINGGQHDDTRPNPDTVISERTKERASLLDPIGFPLLAYCAVCGLPIRIANSYSADWEHQ
jgi:hypothetical protein